MAGVTNFGNVNVKGQLFIGGEEVFPGSSKNVVLIDQRSTATTQEPSAVDTPLRVEFGPAASAPDGSVDMDATGLITINENGIYRFDVTINFGRQTGTGTSELIAATAINGSVPADADPIYASIPIANFVIPGQFLLTSQLTAGTTIEFLIARDASGANSGGLYSFTPTGTLGWPSSPTATLEVTKVTRTTNGVFAISS